MTEAAASKEQFLEWIAARFAERAGLDEAGAKYFAEASYEVSIEDEKIEFGAADHDWSRDGANTIADEEMSCWEVD